MTKIKKKLFKILKKQLLRIITTKLGKVEVTNDKIICYVNNKRLKKHKKRKYIPYYELMLKSKKEFPEETLNIYKVNKPIYYIIENMKFDNALIIIAPSDSNIIFRNCVFKDEIRVTSNSDVILENNKYYDYYPFYTRESGCFLNVNVKNIKFINDNFINSAIDHHPTRFGIDIITNNLKIINSNFDMKKYDGEISVKSKQLCIQNSNINCYRSIFIDSDEINTDNSLIESKTGIMVENKNNNKLLNFTSPKTIYNGVDLSKYHSLDPKNIELQNSRISLLEKLRNLRDKCINIKLSKLKEVETELSKRSIGKIIKK